MNILSVINEPAVVAQIMVDAANPFEKKIAAILNEVVNFILNHESYLEPESYGHDNFENLLITVLNVESQSDIDTLNKARVFFQQLNDVTDVTKAKLFKKNAGNIIDEHYIPTINCAVFTVVTCVNILTLDTCPNNEEQLEILGDLVALTTLLPSLDAITNIFFDAEKSYQDTLDAAKKSLAARKITAAEKALSIHMAQKVWNEVANVSTRALSEIIFYYLNSIVEKYDEESCKSFIKFGLFIEKSIILDRNGRPKQSEGVSSQDGKTEFVPHIKAKQSSISNCIKPYRPDVQYKHPTFHSNNKIDKLLMAIVKCSAEDCSCSKIVKTK